MDIDFIVNIEGHVIFDQSKNVNYEHEYSNFKKKLMFLKIDDVVSSTIDGISQNFNNRAYLQNIVSDLLMPVIYFRVFSSDSFLQFDEIVELMCHKETLPIEEKCAVIINYTDLGELSSLSLEVGGVDVFRIVNDQMVKMTEHYLGKHLEKKEKGSSFTVTFRLENKVKFIDVSKLDLSLFRYDNLDIDTLNKIVPLSLNDPGIDILLANASVRYLESLENNTNDKINMALLVYEFVRTRKLSSNPKDIEIIVKEKKSDPSGNDAIMSVRVVSHDV